MNNRTVLMDMPISVKALIGYDPVDDFYTIYINARHSQSQQLQAYFHEMEHIDQDDLNSPMLSNVGYMEEKRHK